MDIKDLNKATLAGPAEVLAFKRGESELEGVTVTVPMRGPARPQPNTREIREKLGLTPQEFSTRFGLPLAQLELWEDGRGIPAPLALLLRLIERFPEQVAEEVARVAAEDGNEDD
jgi:DNA-binding transcriptional regulator YiaG